MPDAGGFGHLGRRLARRGSGLVRGRRDEAPADAREEATEVAVKSWSAGGRSEGRGGVFAVGVWICDGPRAASSQFRRIGSVGIAYCRPIKYAGRSTDPRSVRKLAPPGYVT